ncbi:hypothetical protein CXQ82_23310 [Pseudomonas sp. S09G 359]|nr:hypothetical protein CXQ82_23310 [Pseudomonas sp. S09G 359]
MGASLLAKAVCQSTDSLADSPHSRASPLPHLERYTFISKGETCPHPAPAPSPTHQTPPATADHPPTYCRYSRG